MAFLCQRFRQAFANCRLGSIGFALCISLQLVTFFAKADINHLELGAANYGHSTYSSKRFLVLEQTFRDLIKKYGPRGTIYLNDINEYGLNLAIEFTQLWLKQHGYTEIAVIKLPGDFNQLDLPKVTSAHLTNPDRSLLPGPENGPAGNKRIVKNLERLASISKTGLAITTYYYGAIITASELLQNSTLENTKRNGYYYFFPDGGDPKTKLARSGMTEFQPRVFVLRTRPLECRVAHGL